MKARIDWQGGTLAVDFSRGRSLAIELDPSGRHPSFFSESMVSASPLRRGDFVGDMASGASCNADVFEICAHSHGTHTECVGHISHDRHAVTATIDQNPTLLRLITVPRESLMDGQFIPPSALAAVERFEGGALAVRTLPNDESKRWCDYDDAPGFPVLSTEAMKMLCASQLLHLLIDSPSIDRADSQGLENHSMWWGKNASVPAGVEDPERRSVTEMIYVPDDIIDGDYWLDLQLSPIVSDAVPSRPIIYPAQWAPVEP
jgi:kynurenine formamidase